MSKIVTNPIKREENSIVSKITNIISSIGFIGEKDKNYTLTDHVHYLLKAAESSELKTRSKIENHLVKLGKKAAPILVNILYQATGETRGLIAMALIRIGMPSVSYLEQAARANTELKWISDYIIEEIEGSQVKLGQFIQDQAFEAALVG